MNNNDSSIYRLPPHQERMTAGKCPDCDNDLHHGPWTIEEIRSTSEDMGMGEDWTDFSDFCDDCFVDMVALGDIAYAQSLAKRPLQLVRHQYDQKHLEHSRVTDGALRNFDLNEMLSEFASSYKKRAKPLVKTYIAFNPASGLIKIGKSINPEKRMHSLSNGAGAHPEILAVINSDVETVLHKKFAAIRVFREWFLDDGSIAAYLSELMENPQNQSTSA